MGDIPALYRRYEEVTGTKVDLPVVAYHTVNFLQLAVIAATMFQIPEVRGANWLEGMLERATIADIERLTGGSHDDLATADAAVMEVIEANDEANDDELVRIMHRRALRLSMIVAGTDPDESNPFFYILEAILPDAVGAESTDAAGPTS